MAHEETRHKAIIFISLSASMLALLLSCAALYGAYFQRKIPPVLIYDELFLADEVGPYSDAGYDPSAIVIQAIEVAEKQGHIIIRSDDNIRASDAAYFRVSDFIAPPNPAKLESNK